MKTTICALLTLGILIGPGFSCPAASGNDAPKVDRVLMKEDKPRILDQGKWTPLEKDVQLTPTILVSTNGTFTVKKGKERKLKEGQVLANDGMLTSPDGSIEPVIDHIVMQGGQLMLYQDGTRTPLTREFTLPSGARIAPDGTMRTAKGRVQRVIDGQIYELDGATVPAKDTVTLRDGTVYVQKDGSQFKIQRAQTIMMNEGTKVYGTGLVLKGDGTKLQLAEGQILTLDGVVVHRR